MHRCNLRWYVAQGKKPKREMESHLLVQILRKNFLLVFAYMYCMYTSSLWHIICVCTCVHVYVYVHVLYVCTCIWMYVYTVYMGVCTCVNYIYTCTCILCMYMHMLTYTCTDIHRKTKPCLRSHLSDCRSGITVLSGHSVRPVDGY